MKQIVKVKAEQTQIPVIWVCTCSGANEWHRHACNFCGQKKFEKKVPKAA